MKKIVLITFTLLLVNSVDTVLGTHGVVVRKYVSPVVNHYEMMSAIGNMVSQIESAGSIKHAVVLLTTNISPEAGLAVLYAWLSNFYSCYSYENKITILASLLTTDLYRSHILQLIKLIRYISQCQARSIGMRGYNLGNEDTATLQSFSIALAQGDIPQAKNILAIMQADIDMLNIAIDYGNQEIVALCLVDFPLDRIRMYEQKECIVERGDHPLVNAIANRASFPIIEQLLCAGFESRMYDGESLRVAHGTGYTEVAELLGTHIEA